MNPEEGPADSCERLVVLLHAYTYSPAHMVHVRRRVAAAFPQAHIFVPLLPLSRWSVTDPVEIARGLVADIEHAWNARKAGNGRGFDDIILMGHSMGALLARKVYLLAAGETEKASFEDSDDGELEPRREWADAVSRIVLLAGMNRGWSISHHMQISRVIALSVGSFLAHLVLTLTGRRLSIFHIRRGAPFLTQMRLQWTAMEQRAKAKPGAEEQKRAGAKLRLPIVVQLLGSIDDLVSPEDNIDLVTGSRFHYLDVPYTGHANVIEMDGSLEGRERAKVFHLALTGTEKQLRSEGTVPADLPPPQPNEDVKHVIFVIHGIRDTGYWTHKIARRVQALAKKRDAVYATETSTYGYFAMLPFVLPARRREKVEWLMDRYTEAQALYPTADFSYVGHSNGTYLLVKALTEYPACRFEQVVFAGSVVPRAYDWQKLIDRKQVKSVLNFSATADWVVAFFPGTLEKLRWQDLGSAGHNGFDQAVPADREGRVFRVGPVEGGHGAALQEKHWDGIANFVLTGQPPDVASAPRAWWVAWPGAVAPLVVAVLVGLLIWLGVKICQAPAPEWARTLGLVGYIFLISKVLTRL